MPLLKNELTAELLTDAGFRQLDPEPTIVGKFLRFKLGGRVRIAVVIDDGPYTPRQQWAVRPLFDTYAEAAESAQRLAGRV
jgi:hypothetical protein